MAWHPAHDKNDADFCKEARHHNDLQNTRMGRWLEAAVRRMERMIMENHDWCCGCGHWNGANLAKCGQCGRQPGATEPDHSKGF